MPRPEPRHLSREQQEALEKMIDLTSVATVVDAVSDLCGEKAHHIRSNWQDNVLANSWVKDRDLIGKIVSRIRN